MGCLIGILFLPLRMLFEIVEHLLRPRRRYRRTRAAPASNSAAAGVGCLVLLVAAGLGLVVQFVETVTGTGPPSTTTTTVETTLAPPTRDPLNGYTLYEPGPDGRPVNCSTPQGMTLPACRAGEKAFQDQAHG